MSWTIDQNQEGITGFKRFIGVTEAGPVIEDIPGAKPFVIERGEIQFEDVSFHYGDSQTPGSRWAVSTYPSTAWRAQAASL